MMTRLNKYLTCLTVFTIIPLSGMATDIYVPSLPAIKEYLDTSVPLTQLSVSIFMLTLGFFQLIAGPLSEHFGRKINLIAGCVLFIIASYFAAHAESIHFFLWMRFFQGIAISLTATTARTIFPDIFSGTEYYKMMNYSTIAWAIGPIVSPAVGGFLQTHFGWHANFYCLAIYTTFVLIFSSLMPETITKKTAFNFKAAFQNYKTIIKHKTFICAFLIISIAYAIVTIFYIVGSFLIQVELNYSPLFYGNLALLLGLAWFIGNITNRIFIKSDPIKKIGAGILSVVLVSTSMVIFDSLTTLNLPTIFVPTFFLIVASGLIFPNGYGLCMRLFPDMSGYASATMGACLFACAALISAGATLLQTHDSMPLSLCYAGISIILLIIYRYGLKPSTEKTLAGN